MPVPHILESKTLWGTQDESTYPTSWIRKGQMYCSILKEQMNRKPSRSRVFKNPRWQPDYRGSDTFELVGEEIERAPKEKWRILIKASRRTNGKVKKDQRYLGTLTYWNIVDDYLELQRHGVKDDCMYDYRIYEAIEKHFPDQQQTVVRLFESKFKPIVQAVIEDYKQSEEYRWLVENERIKTHENPNKARKKHSGSSGTGSRQGQQGQRNDYEGQSQSRSGIGGSLLPGAQKAMAIRLISEGYRRLAREYHPDAGGHHEDMVALNLLKENLDSLTR
jgi:hypothetical protein